MSALNGKEILIVDDSKDVRLLARRILEVDGAIVREADSVDDALALINRHIPHLIITDLALPGKNGFDLLAARLAAPNLAEIPVIVLSGSKNPNAVSKAISMGTSDYIVKPFRATLLLQKARKLLRAGVLKARTFTAKEAPVVDITVGADILEVTEVGCTIDSPVKMADQSEVKIQAEILQQLDLDPPRIRVLGRALPSPSSNRYTVNLNFVGVGDELARKFRAKMRGAA